MDTLARLTEAGVRLEAVGDKLRATGPLTPELRTLIHAYKRALISELTVASDAPSNETSHLWRVRSARGAWVTVVVTPPTTADQVSALYPGATVERLPEESHEAATPQQEVELRALIATALADADEVERTDALAVAVQNPHAALTCFREFADREQDEN
jgi:hypothetical protein